MNFPQLFSDIVIRAINIVLGCNFNIAVPKQPADQVQVFREDRAKKEVYDGIHDPIIDLEIFNQVQELLADNCNSHNRRYKAEHPSLLAGKLFDDNDFIMSPSHAVKKGKRYLYYISQAYLKKRKELAGSLPQVPANELEGCVPLNKIQD